MPVTFDEAVAGCTDDDDCVFPDPESAVYFYNACVAAGIEIPTGVFRVDARISQEFGLAWVTSDNRIVSEIIGNFRPARCTIAGGDSQVTCGINFGETRFECLGPVDPVPALIGSQFPLFSSANTDATTSPGTDQTTSFEASSSLSTTPIIDCPQNDPGRPEPHDWILTEHGCIR